MSCYFRHLKELFAEAGIDYSTANKKELDKAIHTIVNVRYKNCPDAWRALKAGTASADGRRQFVESLKKALTA
jgi:hypothetical protein